MYLKPTYRRGKQGVRYAYYRLCDSYRDFAGVVCRSDLVNVGRLDDFSQKEINEVAALVTEKVAGKPASMFQSEEHPEKVITLAKGVTITAWYGTMEIPRRRAKTASSSC